MGLCKEIGDAYHKTDRENRVNAICKILGELGLILLDPQHEQQTPAEQVQNACLACLWERIMFALNPCFATRPSVHLNTKIENARFSSTCSFITMLISICCPGWGSGDTWSRRRTVADLILLTYYDPFKEELLNQIRSARVD